jgi:hypothetical protein
MNGKSIRKYSNHSEDKNNYNNENNNNNNQNKNLNNKSNLHQETLLDRDFNEELEDKFYYDIPIKDFKKKSQFKESGNFFTLNKNKDNEIMTPQNLTLNNINHFQQNNINNTNTNSNKSNYLTNNQFNFSKNNNMNLNTNFNNNLNNPNNTNLINEGNNKDRNKREIIEEIFRDTTSGSFYAKIDFERPFTPPFTKLVPMSNLEKINSSSIGNQIKDNYLNTNVNMSSIVNKEFNLSRIEKNNLNVADDNYNNNNINNSTGTNININTKNIININNSKIEDLSAINIKVNPNESKIFDRSYRIKDINYMDLIYDHVMGHYYDPKTNIYYELKNIGNANIIEQ